jgi:hypothetical protein
VRFEQAAADVAVGRADAYSAADMLVNDLLDGSP